MKRILVLRGGALGDFLVTLPALQALRRRWPDAQIELVGNLRAGELARDAGLIDRMESQEHGAWHTLFGEQPAEQLQDRLFGPDLVVSYWPDPDGELARLFPRRQNQVFLRAPALPQSAPAARHYFEALAPLKLPPPRDWVVALRPWQPRSRRIALHPGSGSPRKNWPVARWAEIARWLRETLKADVCVIRGEAEAPAVLAQAGTGWNQLPLAQLADELARCKFFLGHDSGVSHLAAACGCPGVLLFGPTDPAVWAPATPRMQVLRAGSHLDAITVDEVQRAILAVRRDQT